MQALDLGFSGIGEVGHGDDALPWNVGSAAPSAEPVGNRERPEAEVSQESETRPVQVILTTHSPNLSSKIALDNLVLMHGRKAYSLPVYHSVRVFDEACQVNPTRRKCC